MEAGAGIFEGLEKVSVVKGRSRIFFNDAPAPPPTLLEPSLSVFVLVMGSSTGFGARTGEVVPVSAVRLVRLEPESKDEVRDFTKELAVGARRVEVLPVTRPVPMFPLLPTLLIRLLAVPLFLVTLRSSELCLI